LAPLYRTIAPALSSAAALLLLVAAPVRAQEPPAPPPEGALHPAYDDAHAPQGDDVIIEEDRPVERGRATTRVKREDLDVRQPRSAPDALVYEPGVYVQQTAHAQGSAFIRGRTGQQTVLLFDEVRLNNSLFRQGPNQYFFTIDSRTIDHIDVLRGSASTRYGSDALAGVVGAVPQEPLATEDGRLLLRPRVMARHTTADEEWGGRLQLNAQLAEGLGILGGIGYRAVGQLESAGPIYNPQDDRLPEVPRFEDDGRTQRGTGFKELTDDLRLVWRPNKDLKLTLAWYDYRQYDAPRTDQCPPAYAPFNECLEYEEQFRSLLYGSIDANLGPLAEESRLILSWQRQHERRKHERPSSFVLNGGRDDVDTFGVLFRAATRSFQLADPAQLRVRYGLDVYRDTVESVAWLTFTDLDITRIRSRGQYLDGSSYIWGGAWSEAEVTLLDQVVVRAGGRLSHTGAQAPGDDVSGTLPVDRTWSTAVGNVGVEWWTTSWLTLLASADQGFRAPNLDDLTSRQQTGPGFQFENAALEPEAALTLEVGAQVATDWIDLDAWVYHSSLEGAIARAPRNTQECPPDTRQCNSSWSRFQLVNLEGEAIIWGAEGSAKLKLPGGVSLRSTLSYAWGDGPNPQDRPADPALAYEERVPLSRIPPLNGTVELLWRNYGAWGGAALRWATLQDRLALGDVSDERIPRGGTPGYAVLDLRAGYRLDSNILASVVFENVTDEAYRHHGSSVNGPGRGFIFSLEAGL
jgi:outer membrane receptor protein involved in Fe transport